MYRSFIGININQFHENQKGAGTTVDMQFVKASSAYNAQKYLESKYPGICWAIIPKQTMDKGMYPKQEAN
jgi:hypothetical protein